MSIHAIKAAALLVMICAGLGCEAGHGYRVDRYNISRPADVDRLLAKERSKKVGMPVSIHVACELPEEAWRVLLARMIRHLSVESPYADGSILHLIGQSNIDDLSLPGADITDMDVAKLVGLNLVSFDFSGTNITDASIPHILQFRYLRHLDVSDTGISKQGLATLEDTWRFDFLRATHLVPVSCQGGETEPNWGPIKIDPPVVPKNRPPPPPPAG